MKNETKKLLEIDSFYNLVQEISEQPEIGRLVSQEELLKYIESDTVPNDVTSVYAWCDAEYCCKVEKAAGTVEWSE